MNSVTNSLKQRFSKNVATTMNVITCGPESNILGFASFPSDAPEASYEHAIILNHATVPGSSVDQSLAPMFQPFSLGITLTHEAGTNMMFVAKELP